MAALAAFSTRRVIPNYNGPLLTVRNGNTQATADFYQTFDLTSLIYGLATSDGTALDTWLAGATGFVTKWFGAKNSMHVCAAESI